MKKRSFALLLAFALAGGRTMLAGAEEKPKQIPEAPPTLEVVAQFLEGYASQQAAAQDGWMKVEDPEAKETLKLRLDKVHRERLSKTADKTYFVCADFKNPEGKRYDLDFWVQGDGDHLKVSDTTIHKVNGVPRYIWIEREGLWKRLPV